MQSFSNNTTESLSSHSACDSIKSVNQTLRQYARACFQSQKEESEFGAQRQSSSDVLSIVQKAKQLFQEQTSDSQQYSFKEGKHLDRNIATYNQMIAIYVNAFQSQVRQQKGAITLKEKKDIQKKQSQQNFMSKISFLSDAFEVYHVIMAVKGVYPDNFTLSQLLRGLKILWQSQLINLQNHQQLYSAQNYLHAVGKQLNFMFNRYAKIIDEIILNSYMDLCVKFQMPDDAIRMYEMVKDFSFRQNESEQNVETQQSSETTPEGLNTADIQSKSKNKSIQVGILIKAYGQQGLLDQAFRLFEDHLSGNDNNDITFGCLIDACVKNGNIEKAEETFEKILQAQGNWTCIKPNTIIYTTMIKAYSRTFKLSQAELIYQKMRNGTSESKPNVITYNSMIDCCVRCEDMLKATELFDQMAQGDVSPDLITYSTLIKGHCQTKNIEKALILHEKMLEQGIKADEVLYNSLLDGCLKANEMDMALKCFKNMKKLKIKASNVTYSILAKIYQKMGEIDKALGILDDMKEEGVKPGVFVFTCMIQTYIQDHQIDNAIKMFDKMVFSGCVPDNVTYYTLVQGCLIQNRQEYALDLLLQAIYKNIQQTYKPKNKMPCFSFQQSQVINSLLQKLMLDENNQTAISRYRDLDFIFNYLDEIMHPYSQIEPFEDQENYCFGNYPSTFKGNYERKYQQEIPVSEIRAPLVALDNFQNVTQVRRPYQTLFQNDQVFEPNFNF